MPPVFIGTTARSWPMRKTLGIPQLVSTIILGMPLVKTAVVANTTFNDDDFWQNNFFRRQGSGIRHWSAILDGAIVFRRPAISHRAIVIRGGNNASRGQACAREHREKLDFRFHISVV